LKKEKKIKKPRIDSKDAEGSTEGRAGRRYQEMIVTIRILMKFSITLGSATTLIVFFTMIATEYYIFTGRDGEVPHHVVSLSA